MSFPVQFLVAALAGWRVTHLLGSEDGPGDLFYRLRAKLGNSFAGKLMDCFYCLSVWVAAPLALWLSRRVLEFLVIWLALSGAMCLLERTTREKGDDGHVLRTEERVD